MAVAARVDAGSEEDVSRASLGEQVRALTWPYWVANVMEVVERLAYYGLRTVVAVYMVLAVEAGGPQLSHLQKGVIFGWWAAVQSFVPIFSGGYADRFGYKRTVAVSIAIKISGYLVMGWALELAVWSSAGRSAGVPEHPAAFGWFFLGAMLLALGTAVFKPGLQGIIATQIDRRNSSMAWGLFYQMVNVGGFLGPFLAAWMRLLAWKWVFVSCAVVVSLNYLLLLAFREPEHRGEPEKDGILKVLDRSFAGIVEPRVFAFLAVFSGFWAMFHQLFDLLPNFIDDWVDTRALFAGFVQPVFAAFGGSPPSAWGGRVPQELLVNVNAGLISVLAFFVGWLTGFVRSMTAMIAGVLVTAAGILLLGTSAAGEVALVAIVVFSLGEMMASPTKLRYFAGIAPPGREGLYLGYINATNGIGWALGSFVAAAMYEEGGDLVRLARRHLVDVFGMARDAVEAIPKTEVVPALAARLGTDVDGARAVLWQAYDPAHVWTWFAIVGLTSMVGLVVFDAITRRAGEREEVLLAVLTGLVTGVCYGPVVGAAFFGLMAVRFLAGNEVAGRTLLLGLVGLAAWYGVSLAA